MLETVASKDSTLEKNIDTLVDKIVYINRAAEYISEEIIRFFQWTTGIKLASKCQRINVRESEINKPPYVFNDFLTKLLMHSNTKKKTLRNNMTRFLESYKADLSFGVTSGKRLPAKHFLLAMVYVI